MPSLTRLRTKCGTNTPPARGSSGSRIVCHCIARAGSPAGEARPLSRRAGWSGQYRLHPKPEVDRLPQSAAQARRGLRSWRHRAGGTSSVWSSPSRAARGSRALRYRRGCSRHLSQPAPFARRARTTSLVASFGADCSHYAVTSRPCSASAKCSPSGVPPGWVAGLPETCAKLTDMAGKPLMKAAEHLRARSLPTAITSEQVPQRSVLRQSRRSSGRPCHHREVG